MLAKMILAVVLASLLDVEMSVSDAGNGAGDRIEIQWQLPAAAPDHWHLLRRPAGGSFQPLAELDGTSRRFVDDQVAADQLYQYQLRGADGVAHGVSPQIQSVARWFDAKRLPLCVALAVIVAIVVTCVSRRLRPARIRKMPGLDAVKEAVGRATEMGRPLLYTSGVGDVRAPGVLASIGILGSVAEEVAHHGAKLKVPVNNALNLAIGQQVVHDAFCRAGQSQRYTDDIVYFISARQFAYAAAVCGVMEREQTAAHLFFGSFWSETLILTETGAATGAMQIAATDSEAQLPFFVATCDHVLMGEELYAAHAYLTQEPETLATLFAQDCIKMILLAILLLGVLLAGLATVGEAGAHQQLLNWLQGNAG